MSLADAIVSLAVLVKRLSDDATDNIGMCQTIGARVELIPRLLEKFPHIAELDDKLLISLFDALKDSRDVISEYGKKGRMSRFFQSAGIKKKFNDLDVLIGQCVDDLTLSVGINSSSKIDELGILVSTTLNTLLENSGCVAKDVSVEEKEDLNALFLLNYNDIQFTIKRGIRKELKVSSSSQARLYLAKYNNEDVVIREPTFDISVDIIQEWRARVVAISAFMRAVQKFPACFAHIYGGGIEYVDEEEYCNESGASSSPATVQQLFVVLKYYPQSTLFNYIGSSEWIVADMKRIISYMYRITFAVYLVYALPNLLLVGEINLLASALLSPQAILLDDTKQPLLSYSHIFQYVSLTSAAKGVTEGSLHFESTPIQTLRWYAPEQLKTDQLSYTENGNTRSSSVDVYTIGLLFCYMLTGSLPYSAFLSGNNDNESESVANSVSNSSSKTFLLLEGMRSGQQEPYDLSAVTTNTSLMHLLSLCLHPNPKNRPSLMFILTSLKTICIEMNLALPFDISVLDLPATSSDSVTGADGCDSGSDNGLLDFDDMTSQVENISSTVKLFRFSANVTDLNLNHQPALVVFGRKVIVLNVNLSKDQSITPQGSNNYVEDGEEDDKVLDNSVSMLTSGENTTLASRGIIIFHIDNTTSMKRQQRNHLTKEVLFRVIPDLLRKNFRIIVNSWASDVITKGKIQTREIRVSQDLLEPERKEDLVKHIQNIVTELLDPSGKTDLYGSIFQLLDQCKALSTDSINEKNFKEEKEKIKTSIFCFVLTDGNHNHFAYPTHAPKCVGENYFGVYSGQFIKNELKFGLSGNQADIPVAEAFLAKKFLESNENSHNHRISLTLIGIGDASTAPLSSLSNKLGDCCSFVGITEISQADCVFSNIDNFSGDANNQLRVSFSHSREGNGKDVSAEFQYVLGDEDSTLVSGCVVISDAVKSDRVINHSNKAVVYNEDVTVTFAEEPFHFDDKSAVSEGSKYNRFSYSLEELVEAVLPILTQIRSTSYDVTAETFQVVFTQLLRDKKQLWLVKTALFAKKTRQFRKNPVFMAFTVWLKELEYLIDSQISSYRVNVEDELFSSLEAAAGATVGNGANAGAGAGAGAQPAAIVLERLKNNLQNTGRKVHQVHRHVSAIRSIRDRTLSLGTSLLSSELTFMPVSDKKEDAGVVLKVLKQNGKQYSVPWTVAVGDGDNFSRLKTLIETVDISQMNNCRSMSTSAMGGIGVLQISFPCVLLQASFDPLTVIRASELFSVQAVCLDATCSHALQFCAEEVWDLCSSSNHLVGNKLPVAQTVQEILQQQQLQCGMDGKEKEGEEVTEKENEDEGNGEGMYNMILPMATTPLLMSLYCERGRLYHNGINITGDVLALTSATGQWAKAFHDILLFLLPRHTCSLSSRGLKASALMDVALRCLVSYSYAIDYPGLAPCINMVEVLYTPIDANIGTETDTDTPIIVMKRDGMSGLTCPLGVAMLAAYLPNHPIACTSQVHAWNTLIVTIFSRLCEAISGQKNIRCNSSNTSLRDPSELETSYRLKVGELQTTLKRRLHLEWANSSREEKLAIIAENAGSILVCLQKIVTEFVNKLDTYNLPTLSRAMCMVKLAMAANNYGIQRLRDIFLKCEDTTNEAVRTLLSLLTAETSNTILPVCLSTTIESVTSLQLRELTVNDHTLMLAYIDAIVATKVSPKIVYKPVVNPSYPTFTASQNDSLHFEKSQIDWDVELPVANVCLIGNVNSGKSSIGGQLLSLLNIVPASALVKMQKMAQKLGRTENLQYAWVMDRLQEERSGGFTVMPKFHGFQTAVRRFSMVDNPGHTDYASNYTTGIYHADVVLLVVSAVASEQQLAEVSRSAAEEHLVTAFCFGIKQVIVLVNKMDLVDNSEQAFLDTRTKAFKHLKKAGFKITEGSVCLPMSALEGDGFLSVPSRFSWYDGPCLLQALDEIPLPTRMEQKSFRMVIDRVYKLKGVGNVLCGKVERGIVCVNDRINIYPSVAEQVTVKSIEAFNNAVQMAKPGDDIGIAISTPNVPSNGKNKATKSGVKAHSPHLMYRRGMIIGLSDEPAVPVMKRFEVQIFLMGKNVTLKVGSSPTILTHLCAMRVTVTRLVQILGKNNTVLEQDPSLVKTGDTCLVEVEAREPIAAETIHDCPKLSRFVMQNNHMTAAIGFIRSKLL